MCWYVFRNLFLNLNLKCNSFLIECECDPDGTDGVCDSVTGECTCKETTTGNKCDQCKDGYFGFPNCKGKSHITPKWTISELWILDCECNQQGSLSQSCSSDGICDCNDGVEGDRCSRCQANHYGFPFCQGNHLLNSKNYWINCNHTRLWL